MAILSPAQNRRESKCITVYITDAPAPAHCQQIYLPLFSILYVEIIHVYKIIYPPCSSSPVVSLKRMTTKKELRHHQVHRTTEAQIFDEELPVRATDIKDVEFQPTPIRQPTTKQFKSPVLMSRRPTDNSISYSSSDGFDNVAFEGFTPPPPPFFS